VEKSESTYCATKLGKTTVFAGLSPESGGMLGGFIRALINLGSKQEELDGNDHNYLRRLGEIDLLFLAAASFEARGNLLKSPSKIEKEKIAQYIEQLDIEDKPLINLWRASNSKEYPTRRLLSSLRFCIDSSRDDLTEATFNKLMGTAILLHRHAKGEKIETLASEYSLYEGTLENGLKFTVLWILSCLAQICSSDKCYKLDFLAMRIYELLEDLTLGSTLGKLLTVKGIGRKSVQKLIDAGFEDIGSLTGIPDEIFLKTGLVASQAKSVKRFVSRRSR
ncbi:MAG: hypothetical protein GY816_04760, partial [Cytophagales bacterium]|nr:hypothetical protein [Cytophagales bacterium]